MTIRTSPQLHALQLLLADTFAGKTLAAAMRTLGRVLRGCGVETLPEALLGAEFGAR